MDKVEQMIDHVALLYLADQEKLGAALRSDNPNAEMVARLDGRIEALVSMYHYLKSLRTTHAH